MSPTDKYTHEQIAANLLAWIHDLETTTEPQTKKRLHQFLAIDGYPAGWCCLGRACVVLRVPMQTYGGGCEGTDGHLGALPKHIYEQLGLTESDHETAWRLNDDAGKTFKEIAAWLRAEILPRYTSEKAAVETVESSSLPAVLIP